MRVSLSAECPCPSLNTLLPSEDEGSVPSLEEKDWKCWSFESSLMRARVAGPHEGDSSGAEEVDGGEEASASRSTQRERSGKPRMPEMALSGVRERWWLMSGWLLSGSLQAKIVPFTGP